MLGGNIILRGVAALTKQLFTLPLFTQLSTPSCTLPKSRSSSWSSCFSTVSLLLPGAAGKRCQVLKCILRIISRLLFHF